MITIEGKDVFTEFAELADPAHTALILVDMQCDFGQSKAGFPTLRQQLHTDTLRLTSALMYVSMRPSTASATSRAWITLTVPDVYVASDPKSRHLSVCSIVTGGESLISAWNLCT